jgi:hypothetical protein
VIDYRKKVSLSQHPLRKNYTFQANVTFSKQKLTSKSIPQQNQEFYMNNYNYLANLQLLEGSPNQEKSDSDFQEWLNKTYKDKDAKSDFMRKNFIPANIDLSFGNFMEFFDARDDLIKHRLKRLLLD